MPEFVFSEETVRQHKETKLRAQTLAQRLENALKVDLSPVAFKLYVHLATEDFRAPIAGELFRVKKLHLAEAISVTPKTIPPALDQLHDAHLIEITMTALGDTGTRQKTEVRLLPTTTNKEN